MKTLRILLVASTALLTANFALAQTWTQTSAPTNLIWTSIVSSADGTKLAALSYGSAIYTSTNSGISWTSNATPANLWHSIASSADGNTLAIGPLSYGLPYDPPPSIYMSTNSGTDWTLLTNGPPFADSIACSADGIKLVVAIYEIYTSTNSGVTWTTTSAPLTLSSYFSLASSADGTKLMATASSTVTAGPIYTSTDSGNTWMTNNVPNQNWCSAASSADGNTLAAVAFGGPIYTSTNSGNTWISNNVPIQNWRSVAMSADGSKLAAVVYGGGIYTSTDSGNTWTSNNVPNQNWCSVASSADGSELVAVAVGGGIWILQSAPTPQLNIVTTNPNLTVSWIIPSTNFVLQQSFDLSSWTDMTDTPALNLTNLQDEMVLSPTNSSVFYRLKTP